MPTRREGSSVEGFGIVYAEAAWYGVPALAGSDGGGSDAVVDGETGWVVDGDNQGAVEAAIGDLLADEGRRKAMGEAARARVLREGTWAAWRAILKEPCAREPPMAFDPDRAPGPRDSAMANGAGAGPGQER